jgi:predicted DNA-binding transcriptional regulator AlpA
MLIPKDQRNKYPSAHRAAVDAPFPPDHPADGVHIIRGPPPPTADDRYLPARQVWERYGVSEMSIYRWQHDHRMAFPPPVYFGRFRYWRLSQLIEWEVACAAATRQGA